MILIIGGFAQGKTTVAQQTFPETELWDDFHLYVKQQLNEGKLPSEITENVMTKISQNKDLVIICNELGCGIVPMEKTDRQWREVTGRILCIIAEKAEKVFRVTCGIMEKIK